MIVPHALYFICGVEAAMSLKRAYRQAVGLCGHAAPFFSLLFAGPANTACFIISTLITFSLFGFFWFRILSEGRNEN